MDEKLKAEIIAMATAELRIKIAKELLHFGFIEKLLEEAVDAVVAGVSPADAVPHAAASPAVRAPHVAVKDLHLPSLAHRGLVLAKLMTLDAIARKSRHELLSLPNVGKASVAAIETALAEHGRKLRE